MDTSGCQAWWQAPLLVSHLAAPALRIYLVFSSPFPSSLPFLFLAGWRTKPRVLGCWASTCSGPRAAFLVQIHESGFSLYLISKDCSNFVTRLRKGIFFFLSKISLSSPKKEKQISHILNLSTSIMRMLILHARQDSG